MFEQSLVINTGTNRPWTVVVGLTGQVLAVGIAVLVPLIYTDKIPRFDVSQLQIAPPLAPRQPSPPPDALPEGRKPMATTTRTAGKFQAPVTTKNPLADIVDLVSSVPDLAPTIIGAMPADGPPSIGRVINRVVEVATAPPPKTQQPHVQTVEKPKDPIRVSQGVQDAKILKRVIPIYPALARQARVSGVVRLTGIIGTDGTIQRLQVVSGHPLLVPAAVDAVRQWLYSPTLLSGQAVEVIAPIEVNFILAR